MSMSMLDAPNDVNTTDGAGSATTSATLPAACSSVSQAISRSVS